MQRQLYTVREVLENLASRSGAQHPLPVLDAYGNPLTWSSVRHSHDVLVRHAECEANAQLYFLYYERREQGHFDSDDEDEPPPPAPCPCTYDERMDEELADPRRGCLAWPGPTCGVCMLGGELRGPWPRWPRLLLRVR